MLTWMASRAAAFNPADLKLGQGQEVSDFQPNLGFREPAKGDFVNLKRVRTYC